MPDAPKTQGVHHIGLTVPDVKKARDFFVDVLGFRQFAERPRYPAIFVSDGIVMLTLWQAADPATAVRFDRRNVIGLHHFALRVDGDALDALHERLKGAEGVTIEFAPETLGDGPARHMMFAIPGGVRMELIAASG
ncbi:MAG: VOC family protein [Defluviicoccus sp.]|nr:VOC family protein [Defluviicoccus sp.]MDE0274379.1 VOC family protein [Defluviicoccus sp.]